MTTAAPSVHARELSDAPDWWRQAVVYQVYPRSFADSNGDGLGDIPGITSRVPYLAELGVDAIWLSPFYPSALADGGYDVADYRNVDPRLGTLADMDELIAQLHAHGIRVIVDIVPNHTSNDHAWFQEALAAGRGSAARERYIFREGTGPDGSEPPTDWQSTFGGPAWERVADGQWYMHHFDVSQPDLNWANPEVRADFVKTLRFWSDRGVDGFRIDVAHMLTKDLSEPLPSQAEIEALPQDGSHPLFDRDDVHEVYAEWRAVFNSYDPPRTAVAEAWVHPSRVPLYASIESLGQSFNFDLLEADFDAGQFRRIVADKPRARRTVGVVDDVGAVEPRRRPPRHALRSARCGAWCQRSPDAQARKRMAALRRHLARARHRAGRASRPSGGPVRAGAAGLGVPVPGRGARPARGRGDPRRPASGPDVLPQPGRRHRAGWMPRAAPVGGRRRRVRFRRGLRAPAPAGLVRDVRRRPPGRRSRLDAVALPPGPRSAARPAGRGGAGVARPGPRRRGGLRPPRRLDRRDELRRRVGGAPAGEVLLSSAEVAGGALPGEASAWLRSA